MFDVYGQFVPELMRRKEEVVYRGCFVLDIHKVTTVFIVKLPTKFYTRICATLLLVDSSIVGVRAKTFVTWLQNTRAAGLF